MKTIITVLFTLVAVNAHAYDIDPATGFIRGQTPEAIARALPPVTDETRTSGDVYIPANYGADRNFATSISNRSYVTSAGSFMVSRSGSTTFVIQTSRGRR